MSDRDYYEILGLTPRADGAMVDQAYWHLARKYQSLAATNARAQYMLDELNEAYGVLGNPKLREQYDAFRDDVLVRQGMIRPVRSKPASKPNAEKSAAKASRTLPSFKNAPFYAVAVIVGALAVGGMYLGLSWLFVAPVFVAALAVAATPTVKGRLAGANLSMPSMTMPSMPAMPTMPTIQTPKLSMPSLSDTPLGGQKDEGGIDADQLRVSTAATIARWRKSVGLRQLDTSLATPLDGPDTTLVDIVASERDLDDTSEPLSAVLDILRGSSRPVNSN